MDDLVQMKKAVETSPLFAEGKAALQLIAHLPAVLASGLRVVEGCPAFLVSVADYETYRACTLDEASEFEDHYQDEATGQVVSRSCLLSFVANLRHLPPQPLLYLSVGAYARVETEILPGVREPVFPQLEAEILAPSIYTADELLKLLLQIQHETFRLIGLKNQPRVRLNNHNAFVKLISKLPYLVQRKVRKLMDKLETARAESENTEPILAEILGIVPPPLHATIRQWTSTPFDLNPTYPEASWSRTLVGGPLTYEGLVFETDYTTTTGRQFTEVAGGGNFSPLARRFGMPQGWQAIGFAVGLLRLGTARSLEQT